MKHLIIFLLFTLLCSTSCKKDKENDPNYDFLESSLLGKWYSAGDNMSVMMKDFYGIDSIYLEFGVEDAYYMESFGDRKKHTYSGVYLYEESEFGSICSITLTQNSPIEATYEGIFEIILNKKPYTMLFEVIQTLPFIVFTPPTAAEGFGSSDNGALQHRNTQRFIKLANN